MADGIITKDDLITRDALQFGVEYASNVEIAIKSNEALKQSAKEVFSIFTELKGAVSNEDFKKAKEGEAKAINLATEALKKREKAAISADKIKQSALRTEKLSLDVKTKSIKIDKDLLALEEKKEKLNQQQIRTAKEKVDLEKKLEGVALERQRVEAQSLKNAGQVLSNLDKEEKLIRSKLATVERENKVAKEQTATVQAQQVVWKEQLALENNLIKKKRERELISESTSRAVIKETAAISQEKKEIKASLTAMGRLSLKRNQAVKSVQEYQAKVVLGEKISNKEQKEILESVRAFEKYDKAVKTIKQSTNQFQESVGKYPQQIQATVNGFKQLVPVLGVIGAVRATLGIVRDAFTTVVDFDRQLIAVGKTTNITGEALTLFGDSVVKLGKDLDGVSIEGLLKSAEIAGQLGVQGTDNILKFSTAIEQLKLTSDIISDEQVQNFAKFIEVSQDSFENADRLASVMTVLGNNFATTESQILSNATEIQKGVSLYNASAEGILGLGAATSALGNASETSKTAIQKTFAVIDKAIFSGKNLEEILSITNLTQAELSKQFNKDATGVFTKFVKGLGKIKDEGGNVTKTLNELGLSNVRTVTVVGSLAANYDILGRSLEFATEEYQENLALANEVGEATKSVSSIVGDIKDKWAAYTLETNRANSITDKMSTVLIYVRDNLDKIVTIFAKYGAVLLTYLGVMKAINLTTAAFVAIKSAAAAAELRFALATGIGRKAVLAQAVAVRAAAVAQTGLNVAMSASPWGLIIGLIAALVVAYKVFNSELSENEEIQKRINDNLEKAKAREKVSAEQSRTFHNELINQVTEEYALKRAARGASQELDDEEIEAKRKVADNALEVNQMQIDANTDLLNSTRETADEEIKILEEKLKVEQDIRRSQSRADTYGSRGNTDTQDNIKDKIKEAKIAQETEINNLKAFNLRLINENKEFISDKEALDKKAALKEAEENLKIEKENEAARKRRLAAALAFKKLLLSDKYNLKVAQLKSEIDAQKKIIDNDKENVGIRLLANKAYVEESLELLEFQKAQAILNSEGRADEITRIELDFKNKSNAITESREANAIKILKDGYEEAKKIIEARNELQNSETTVKITTEQVNLKKDIEEVDDDGNDVLSPEQKLTRIKEFEDKVTEIKREAEETRLKDKLDSISEQLANPLLNPEDRLELEKALADARIEFNNAVTDNVIANAQKEADAIAAVQALKVQMIDNFSQVLGDSFNIQADTISNFLVSIDGLMDKTADGMEETLGAIQAGFAVVGEIGNAVFQQNIDNIQIQIEESETYYQRQFELASGDKIQQELIRKEGELKRQELEKKKRAEQIKQAKFNKALAIVDIGIATALGMMQAFAQLGPIGGAIAAAIVAALGIAQTVIVATKPIPKYRYGTKDKPHPGGFAEVAEVRPEVIVEPGKKPYIQRKRATLNLAPGTEVIPSLNEYEDMRYRGLMEEFNIQNHRVKNYESDVHIINLDNSEVVKELRLTRKQLERSRNKDPQQIDFNHELFRLRNTNWDA